MQKILIAMLAMLSFATLGCKKKSADSGGDMTAKMTEYKNQMCACKPGDKVCADKVNEDMKKWSEQHAKSGEHKADPEMAKKMEPITKEFGECMMKAMTPAGGETGAGGAAGSGAMGSDHSGMDHGSGHMPAGSGSAGSAMGSDHAHGSDHPHGAPAKK